MNDIQVVLLECPYDTLPEAQTQEFFGKSMGLRIQGYKSHYGEGVFPLDVTDFIGAHILVCKRSQGGLRAISTVKIIRHSQCLRFNVAFPAMGVALSTQNKAQVGFIEQSIALAKQANTDLSYLTGWTLDPNLSRTDRDIAAQMKKILIATIVNYHRLHNIKHSVVGGNVRYKTDKMSETWGFKYGTYNGEPLPQFGASYLFGTPAVFMRLEEFSHYATSSADEYLTLWKNRVDITESEEPIIQKAA